MYLPLGRGEHRHPLLLFFFFFTFLIDLEMIEMVLPQEKGKMRCKEGVEAV